MREWGGFVLGYLEGSIWLVGFGVGVVEGFFFEVFFCRVDNVG